MTDRHRLVVLFGGQSAEHDVSCVTARHVLAAASAEKYEVEAIGITRAGQWMRTDAPALLAGTSAEALPAALSADDGTSVEPAEVIAHASLPVVVLPLLHGPMGEDGTVQGLLDLANIPYVGAGVLGSALCMDKAMAKQVAASFGIAQVPWRTLRATELSNVDGDELFAALGPTIFIKPANMGSSVGVSRVTTTAELTQALEHAASYDEYVIAEQAVDAREIEVGLLGNRPLVASVPGEIVPGDDFYSYDDKYHDGVAKTLIPAELEDSAADEVRALACRAGDALRVQGLARADFFYEQHARGFLLNEVNTMPGFTPISMFPKLWQASGLEYPELIDRLVELAIERHRSRLAHRNVAH